MVKKSTPSASQAEMECSAWVCRYPPPNCTELTQSTQSTLDTVNTVNTRHSQQKTQSTKDTVNKRHSQHQTKSTQDTVNTRHGTLHCTALYTVECRVQTTHCRVAAAAAPQTLSTSTNCKACIPLSYPLKGRSQKWMNFRKTSCRAIAIYDLPINLRYIYKRVSPLLTTQL